MELPIWKLNNTVTILWDITYACNLHCKHCFVPKSRQRDESISLSKSETEKLLSNVCAGNEIIKEFNLQGGEPLCAKNFMYAVEWLGKNNIPWSINTNGCLWTEEHFDLLTDNPPIVLTVSLDGHNETTHDWLRGNGVFKKLTKTINRLHQIKTGIGDIKIDAICVLHKQNINHFTKILDLASDFGIGEIVLANLSIAGSAKQNRKELEIESSELFRVLDFVFEHDGKYKNMLIYLPWVTPIMINSKNRFFKKRFPVLTNGCQAIRSEVCISPGGYLRPCPNALDRLRDKFGEERFPINTATTSLLKYKFTQIRSNKIFNDSYEYLHGEFEAPRLHRCLQCRFQEMCSPCPSLRFSKEYPFEELCYSYQEQLKDKSGIFDLAKHKQLM